MKNPVLVALLCFSLSACAQREAPPETVGEVDLQRYQGTWYEIARLPMFFQRKCVQSQADYRLRVDCKIAVLNQCRTGDGEWVSAAGAAESVEGRSDRLQVRFDNWFSRLFPALTTGDYWVLHLDEGYQVALVGHPDRKYLWLLAREPQISAAKRDELLQVAREQGYQLDELIWRDAER